MSFLRKLASRKLFAAIIATVVAPYLASQGFSPEVVKAVTDCLMLYIGGQTIIDTVTAAKAKPAEATE